MSLRNYLLSFIVVFLSTSSNAQDFRSGLILGFNGSQITGDAMQGFNKGGILGGVFSEYKIAEKPSTIRLEILFAQKGSRREILANGNYGPGIWNLMRLNYIDVPVLYSYNISEILSYFDIEKEGFWINGGLAGSVLVGEFQVDDMGTEIPEPDFANQFELSFLLGAEYKLNEKFQAYARYQSSIYDMSIGASSPFWKVWGYTNRGFINVIASFGVRYYFKSV